MIFDSCKWCFCFFSHWVSPLRMRLSIVDGSSKRAVHRGNIILSENCLRKVFENSFVFIAKHHLYFTESLLLFNFIDLLIGSKRLIISVLNFRMRDLCYFGLNVRFCDFWNVDCFKLVSGGLLMFVILWHKKQIRFAEQILPHFQQFCRLMNRRINIAVIMLPPFSVRCLIEIFGQFFSVYTQRNVAKFLVIFLYHDCLSFLCHLPLCFLLLMLVRLP